MAKKKLYLLLDIDLLFALQFIPSPSPLLQPPSSPTLSVSVFNNTNHQETKRNSTNQKQTIAMLGATLASNCNGDSLSSSSAYFFSAQASPTHFLLLLCRAPPHDPSDPVATQTPPHDNQLSYLNGETQILSIDRYMRFPDFHSKLAAIANSDEVCVKYQLPGVDLDALISVTNDEDLEHMILEFDCLHLHRASNSFRPDPPLALGFSPFRSTPITSSARSSDQIGRIADELPPQPLHLTPPSWLASRSAPSAATALLRSALTQSQLRSDLLPSDPPDASSLSFAVSHSSLSTSPYPFSCLRVRIRPAQTSASALYTFLASLSLSLASRNFSAQPSLGSATPKSLPDPSIAPIPLLKPLLSPESNPDLNPID